MSIYEGFDKSLDDGLTSGERYILNILREKPRTVTDLREISDNIDLDRPINFIPDITLLDSNGKAIFDYSDCTDENTLEYLNTILDGATLSDTITVQNASHLDSLNQEESDLSGTYTITGIYDKIITTTVSSLSSGQSYDKKYVRDSFVDDIKIKINASNIALKCFFESGGP